MMVLGRVDNMSLDNLTVSSDGGNGVGNSLYFSYDGVLTENEAMELQVEYGYHFMGYGFYNFRVVTLDPNEIEGVTSWECSRSCD